MATEKSIIDILADVRNVFGNKWTTHDAQDVPSLEELRLSANDAAEFDATVLYADMEGSTDLVRGYKNWFAAEIYKVYLRSVADVLRNNSGAITAYDGDRVMAVFIGDSKNTSACRAAMQLVYLIRRINGAIADYYTKSPYRIGQHIGIDSSHLFVVRSGVRGANDLVWVGEAANVAAKLSSVDDESYSIYATRNVYDSANSVVKNINGTLVWYDVDGLKAGRRVCKTNYAMEF